MYMYKKNVYVKNSKWMERVSIFLKNVVTIET